MKTYISPGVTPCPRCGQIGLKLETKFEVKETDTVLLHGPRKNLTGKFLPHLECIGGCGWQAFGRIQVGQMVFSFEEPEA